MFSIAVFLPLSVYFVDQYGVARNDAKAAKKREGERRHVMTSAAVCLRSAIQISCRAGNSIIKRDVHLPPCHERKKTYPPLDGFVNHLPLTSLLVCFSSLRILFRTLLNWPLTFCFESHKLALSEFHHSVSDKMPVIRLHRKNDECWSVNEKEKKTRYPEIPLEKCGTKRINN